MASSTHPPAGGGTSDPVSSLYLSDTFYTWFNVSNDLINKVNPIEIYSITADQRDYTTVGADGITIDDLGFGNYRIGYILPANVTGGHTFHQDINFAAGVSGYLVNTVNGRTGAVNAVQTVSGYTASFSGFTGNIPGAVFTINGVTASTAGSMTLDFLGQLTGDAGTIAASTGGAGGTYERRVQLFTSAAATQEDQVALRVRGTTADAGVGIGNTAPDGSYGLQIDSTYLNTVGGASAGGISIKTDINDSYNVMTDGQGAFGAGATLYIVSGYSSNSASTVFRHADGSGFTAPSAGSDLFKVDDEGIVLSGKVKDKDGTSGTTDDILVSNSNSKLSFTNIMAAIGGVISDAGLNQTSLAVGEFGEYSTGDRCPAESPQSVTLTVGSGQVVVAFAIRGNGNVGGIDVPQLLSSATGVFTGPTAVTFDGGGNSLAGWAIRLV